MDTKSGSQHYVVFWSYQAGTGGERVQARRGGEEGKRRHGTIMSASLAFDFGLVSGFSLCVPRSTCLCTCACWPSLTFQEPTMEPTTGTRAWMDQARLARRREEDPHRCSYVCIPRSVPSCRPCLLLRTCEAHCRPSQTDPTGSSSARRSGTYIRMLWKSLRLRVAALIHRVAIMYIWTFDKSDESALCIGHFPYSAFPLILNSSVSKMSVEFGGMIGG